MKKLTLILCMVVVLLPGLLQAAKVDKNTARTVAENFFFEKVNMYKGAVMHNSISVSSDFTVNANEEPAFYIFNMNGGGWVIVSAEDTYEPVIGYNYENEFNYNTLPTPVKGWMDNYKNQINYLRDNNVVAEKSIHNQWNHFTTNDITTLNTTKAAKDIQPLLSSTWNQDWPYNALCPEDNAGPGKHVYAGCVATAMSIIMHYYRYPLQGIGEEGYYAGSYGYLSVNYGETEYNWDAMMNQINGSSGTEAISAIAELQYHCGVAVHMNYSPDGSGAYSFNVPDAIKSHFGYSNNAQHISKGNYTNAIWMTYLKTDLDAKHPLYYSGQSNDGGHAFVCDGYEGTNFHFNFGWSGSGNGFFSLNDVGGFSSGQACVRNFYPDDNYPYGCTSRTITATNGNFEDGSGRNGTYTANVNAEYLIEPTENVETINMSFPLFDLGSGDKITVYDGNSSSASVLGEFTSSTTPGSDNITSTGGQVLVVFTTDGADEGEGWQIEYTSTLPTFCTGETKLYADQGDITDGSEENNYHDNSICRWRIEPHNATEVTITFSELDLADGDKIDIHDLGSNQLLQSLTGSELPDAIVSPSGKMYLTFKTNNMATGQGFSAHYVADNVGIEALGFKSLKVFPNPAVNDLNVRFTPNEAGNMSIELANTSGQIVYSKHMNTLGETNVETIDVSSLAPGIYMLNLTGTQGKITHKVFIR